MTGLELKLHFDFECFITFGIICEASPRCVLKALTTRSKHPANEETSSENKHGAVLVLHCGG